MRSHNGSQGIAGTLTGADLFSRQDSRAGCSSDMSRRSPQMGFAVLLVYRFGWLKCTGFWVEASLGYCAASSLLV